MLGVSPLALLMQRWHQDAVQRKAGGGTWHIASQKVSEENLPSAILLMLTQG